MVGELFTLYRGSEQADVERARLRFFRVLFWDQAGGGR